MRVSELKRDSDGKLPAYACPKCANDYQEGRDNPDQLKPILADVYWDGPTIQCENCNADIESAYGDPEDGGYDVQSYGDSEKGENE